MGDDLNLNNELYLVNDDKYPEREMHFLNNFYFLNNDIYLRNTWSNDDWFLLTKTDDDLKYMILQKIILIYHFILFFSKSYKFYRGY